MVLRLGVNALSGDKVAVAAPTETRPNPLPLSEPAGNLFGADARKPLRDFHRPAWG